MNKKNTCFQILKANKRSQLGPTLQSIRTRLVTIQLHSPPQTCRLQTQYTIIPLPVEGRGQVVAVQGYCHQQGLVAVTPSAWFAKTHLWLAGEEFRGLLWLVSVRLPEALTCILSSVFFIPLCSSLTLLAPINISRLKHHGSSCCGKPACPSRWWVWGAETPGAAA